MSLLSYVRGQLRSRQAARQRRAALAGVDPALLDVALEDWSRSLTDPTGYYLDCFRAFHLRLPAALREHRAYFTTAGRGFGEDAFHAMWSMLFGRFPIRSYLEIGVFRGQTLTLAALLQQRAGMAVAVAGISPFEAIGDSVSRYPGGIDYEADTRSHFRHFGLPEPHLLKAYSTDATALDLIASRPWDCIYIDGNHDYEIVRADWQACAAAVPAGGLIVLDDAGLTTRYTAPAFATKGHPGPSRLAAEIDRAAFTEILQVGHNRVFQKR